MAPLWQKILLFVSLLHFVFLATAEVPVPPLKSRVTDLTETLSAKEVVRLEKKLAVFEESKGSQIAVLIVPSTYPETIEQYSFRVVEAWKLGREKMDDGVLLLVSVQDRATRLEIGYGLEGVLPDVTAKRIVDETMVPKFKRGDFAGGLDAGLERVIGVIEGERLPRPGSRAGMPSSRGSGAVLENIIPVFIVLLVAGKIMESLFGRMIGATITGAAGGFMAWFIFSSLIVASTIAIFMFILGLAGISGSATAIGRRNLSGWHHSGGGGMGRIGGGFGGGGGGFGGGGASGRW